VGDADLLTIGFPTLLVVPDWIGAHCIIPDGDGKGQPFDMYDWQLHCTLHHYRVKPSARPGQLASAFRYRRSQVIGPQKTGKGPWSASMVAAEGLGPVVFAGWAKGGETFDCRDHGCSCGFIYEYEPGEPMGRPWPTPLIQLLATAEDQTDNIYMPLQAMARYGPLAERMRTGEEFIRLPNDGKIEVVTSSAQSRLGNPIIHAMQDETGLYTSTNKMIKVAETQRRGAAGMGGRSIETTNPYDPAEDTTARRTHTAKAKDIFRYYDPPPEDLDYAKVRDRHKIHVYNYRLSPHVEVANIDAEASELCELDQAQAERFYGNRIRSASDTAFGVAQWKKLVRPGYMPAKGALIVAGVDGARYDDAIALVATEVATGFQWPLGIWERPESAGDDYEHPLDQVDAMMVDAFATYSVWRVYIDPQYIDHLVDLWCGRWGTDKIKAWVTSRPRPIAWALRGYAAAQKSGAVSHNGDDRFTAHIGNAKRRTVNVFDDDHKPMWGISKDAPHSPLKIDAAMAGCLSWECRGDAIAAGAKEAVRQKASVII
jgi:hypothetical protein